MLRIYESWCGDAYGMVNKMLDASGARSERAMNAWFLCRKKNCIYAFQPDR